MVHSAQVTTALPGYPERVTPRVGLSGYPGDYGPRVPWEITSRKEKLHLQLRLDIRMEDPPQANAFQSSDFSFLEGILQGTLGP